MKDIIFRVDAYADIGTGHFMRCLSLADAYKERGQGQVFFITHCSSCQLIKKMEERTFGFYLLNSPSSASESLNVVKSVVDKAKEPWVLLDGMQFDDKYQLSIIDTGCELLVIDDMAALNHYYAHIVLNQNLHASGLRYNCEPFTELLIGTDYVLLRREFRRWPIIIKEIRKKAQNILVSLGGADVQNYSAKVLLALGGIKEVEIILVVGASNPNIEYLQKIAARNVKVVHNVQNMSELMAWADVAIASGGTTVWELAFMGVPAVIGRIAPIEDYLICGLNKIGLYADIGWYGTVDLNKLKEVVLSLLADMGLRVKMSKQARQLVKGNGAELVLNAMENYKKTDV